MFFWISVSFLACLSQGYFAASWVLLNNIIVYLECSPPCFDQFPLCCLYVSHFPEVRAWLADQELQWQKAPKQPFKFLKHKPERGTKVLKLRANRSWPQILVAMDVELHFVFLIVCALGGGREKKGERGREPDHVCVCMWGLSFTLVAFIHSFSPSLFLWFQNIFSPLFLPLKHNQNWCSGSTQWYGCGDCQLLKCFCTWWQITVATNLTWMLLYCQGVPQHPHKPATGRFIPGLAGAGSSGTLWQYSPVHIHSAVPGITHLVLKVTAFSPESTWLFSQSYSWNSTKIFEGSTRNPWLMRIDSLKSRH